MSAYPNPVDDGQGYLPPSDRPAFIIMVIGVMLIIYVVGKWWDRWSSQ